MFRKVCVYKGKWYGSIRQLENNKICILCSNEDSIIVDIDEVDEYYSLKYTVIYKGYPFIPMAMSKNVLRKNEMYIVTEQKELVDMLELEPFDRMEYGRLVAPTDIDYLIVEKTYLVGKYKGKKEILNVDLIQYISDFQSF